jgi:hypothetical protein
MNSHTFTAARMTMRSFINSHLKGQPAGAALAALLDNVLLLIERENNAEFREAAIASLAECLTSIGHIVKPN